MGLKLTGSRHITSDRQGNLLIQNEQRKATHVVVDGKSYNIQRSKSDHK